MHRKISLTDENSANVSRVVVARVMVVVIRKHKEPISERLGDVLTCIG
jgi:hypothetical protein